MSDDRPTKAPGGRVIGVRLPVSDEFLHDLRRALVPSAVTAEEPDDPTESTGVPEPEYSPLDAERHAGLSVRFLVAAVVVSTIATTLGLAMDSAGGTALWVLGFIVTVLLGWLGIAFAWRAMAVPEVADRDFEVKVLTLAGLAVVMMVPFLLALIT